MSGAGKRLVVVGAGGNIGSHLVPHLARQPEVGSVTLIDPGRYEAKDVAAQSLRVSDVGRRKVTVQARRLRRIRPALAVRSQAVLVEQLPLGALDVDLILACLDSRRSRQYVNQAAWRLGVPWVDAGVDAGGLLARIDVYAPGPGAPCLECAWDDRDYELVEQVYACDDGSFEAPATGAPSSLGALAASLQALEARRLLADGAGADRDGFQVVIDARHYRLLRTQLRRNPDCRMQHDVWSWERLGSDPAEATLGGLFAADPSARRLSVAGRQFVWRLTCTGCGRRRARGRFDPAQLPPQRRCSACGAPLVAAGFDVAEQLEAAGLPLATLGRSLRGVGIRPGDVMTLCGTGPEKRFLITGDRT